MSSVTGSTNISERKRCLFWIPCSLLALINLLLWCAFFLSSGHLVVTFLDVGEGDCAYVEFPRGGNMLIDGGRGGIADCGGRIVLPFLRSCGARRLDAVLATHPDDDHVGGLTRVIEEHPVHAIFEEPYRFASLHYDTLEKTREGKKLELQTLVRGSRIEGYPGVEILVLNPPGEQKRFASSNNNSVVILLRYGKISFLFTGDIEREAEDDMLEAGLTLAGTVLKVAHHGSSTSSSWRFLQTVRPKIAVISVGERNQYGHPAESTLERLEALGPAIYRTDRDGAITITTDGKKLRVKTMLGQHSPWPNEPQAPEPVQN